MKSRNLFLFRRVAFSLVELLVVVGIIVLIISLLIPAFRGISGGIQLTTAASSVVAELNLTRQTALSESQEVELRFYKLPDANGQEPAFRTMQRYRVSDDQPLGKITHIPPPIVLTDMEKFSTLLSSFNGGAVPKTQNTLQGMSNVPYRSVRFRASGATSLDPLGANGGADRWFLSVVNQNDLRTATAESAKPCNNFITIQIDPVTGRTRTFQP